MNVNDTAMHRYQVYLPTGMVNAIDQACLNERKRGNSHVSRSVVIAAIIESVDLPTVVAKLAKGAR